MLEPTSTWSTSPGAKVSGPKMHGKDLICDITIEDDRYYWLNEGTSVRHAVMPFPFYPKTSPGSFVATGGRDHVYPTIVSRRISMPGIQAREWTPMAAQIFGPELELVGDRIAKMFGDKIVETAVGVWSRFEPD